MSPHVLTWIIAAVATLGVIVRPFEWAEATWAVAGAAALVAFGLLSLQEALIGIGKGGDVYLFLIGMMLLAEVARKEGLFDWLAAHATRRANGSARRLFLLIYGVGAIVTTFLSNDATAVVLTPAVAAAVKAAKAEQPLPYLLICAFIANAASFVLPISNPANLVVYGKHLPALFPWLRTFLLPSICSIFATYAVLRWTSRKDLTDDIHDGCDPMELSQEGRFAAWGIAVTGAILMGASGFGLDLGLPTCISAAGAVLLVTRARSKDLGEIIKEVSWSVLPLVAGLFVLVEAVNQAGALHSLGSILQSCAQMPKEFGTLATSFGIAGLSNVVNNLPSGLLAGGALQTIHVPSHIRDAVLVGVDLGPNLSVTGSLATVLWLIALRREGEHVSGWQFLKTGLLVMPPALFLGSLAVSLFSP